MCYSVLQWTHRVCFISRSGMGFYLIDLFHLKLICWSDRCLVLDHSQVCTKFFIFFNPPCSSMQIIYLQAFSTDLWSLNLAQFRDEKYYCCFTPSFQPAETNFKLCNRDTIYSKLFLSKFSHHTFRHVKCFPIILQAIQRVKTFWIIKTFTHLIIMH